MSYPRSEQVALALIPKFTGSIGLFCSIFLITELIRDHVNKEGNAIKRALLGVCFYEVLDSFGWWLSSWALPSSTDFVWSVGTTGSCNFQGFLLQSAIGNPLNYVQLNYYFYLVATKNRTIDNLGVREWKIHTLLAFYAFGTGLMLLFLQQYNPISQVCWVNGYPAGCQESVFGEQTDDAILCDRGVNAHIYGLVLFYMVLWICIIVITYFNLRIRNTLVKANSEDADWISTQALLFSCAFIVTWLPSTLWSVMTFATGGGFWLDLLAVIFEPMQGVWNLLIFLRNRPDTVERLYRVVSFQFCHPSDIDDTIENKSTDGDDDMVSNKPSIEVTQQQDVTDSSSSDHHR